MEITIIGRNVDIRTRPTDHIFLIWDGWNDFSFYTLYGIKYFDDDSSRYDLGSVKIGYIGQKETERRWAVNDNFEKLPSDFFSVGLDEDYYHNLNAIGVRVRDSILGAMNDIAKFSDIYENISDQEVFRVSFLRGLSALTIRGQFRRLASGGARLTPYNFTYHKAINKSDSITFDFTVVPESSPPSNIHILIGRNGVGKTLLINSMINSLIRKNSFSDLNNFTTSDDDDFEIFANLICVSFSAFDEFKHPPEKRDKSAGINYSYIGLKKEQIRTAKAVLKAPEELGVDFYNSLVSCINSSKNFRWTETVKILESDPLFKEYDVSALLDQPEDKLQSYANSLFAQLSSGHKVILLTLTRLVETVQERSLVLIDEPESHLHPPLLSSFTVALSTLLTNANAVCVIASHSPVILQEVPRNCIWKMRRSGDEVIAERPSIETFGENVGVLTQEVFGLEVTDSGFHRLLKRLVEDASTYNEAVDILDGSLGLEGKAILRSLFFQKNTDDDLN